MNILNVLAEDDNEYAKHLICGWTERATGPTMLKHAASEHCSVLLCVHVPNLFSFFLCITLSVSYVISVRLALFRDFYTLLLSSTFGVLHYSWISFNASLPFFVQYAIVFKTPKYKEEFISRPVIVSMQLYRPSDSEGSDPIQFTYMPEDPGLLIAYIEGWVGFIYMPQDHLRVSVSVYA